MLKYICAIYTILFVLVFQVSAQKPTPKSYIKNYSFTGRVISDSVVSKGEEYIPGAKPRATQRELGVSDLKYRTITGVDFSSAFIQGEKVILIPKNMVAKLEAGDNSVTAMFVFSLCFYQTDENSGLKSRVLSSDRKALKFMKEHSNATQDQIKVAYNKILESPKISGYPSKSERLKIAKEIFPPNNAKPKDDDKDGGEDSNNSNDNQGSTDISNLPKGNVYLDNNVNYTRYATISNEVYTNEIMVLGWDGAFDYDVPAGVYTYTLKDENHKFISTEEIKVEVGKTKEININD